jgi:hypothetical protein
MAREEQTVETVYRISCIGDHRAKATVLMRGGCCVPGPMDTLLHFAPLAPDDASFVGLQLRRAGGGGPGIGIEFGEKFL